MFISMIKETEFELSEHDYLCSAKFRIKNTTSYILQDDLNIYGIIDICTPKLSNVETYAQGLEIIRYDLSLFKRYESNINNIDIEEKTIKSLYPNNICHIKVFQKKDISEINKYKSYGYRDLPISNIPEYSDKYKSQFLVLYNIKKKTNSLFHIASL